MTSNKTNLIGGFFIPGYEQLRHSFNGGEISNKEISAVYLVRLLPSSESHRVSNMPTYLNLFSCV